MSRTVLFITHADVGKDPAVPVPRWPLSEAGRARHLAFNASAAARAVTAIYCSGEQKAIDGAEILTQAAGAPVAVVPDLHENDRSATGFLPPALFEATADRFFAQPEQSIDGWERAVDAQARIAACVDGIVRDDRTDGAIAIVAHGGVGALLLCRLLGVPISRTLDQPGGRGGNYFAFDAGSRAVLHAWRDIGVPAAAA